MGSDLTTRIGIRDRILGIYRKRNSIVHGGEDERITTEDFIRLRGTVHDLIKAIIEKRDQFEAPDGAYTIARYLQDYKLAPKRT